MAAGNFYRAIEILLLCAAPLAAQTVDMNATSTPPAASTDTATSSGTATAPPPVDLSTGTAEAKPAPPPKPAPPANPIRVKLHKEAAEWEPVSVRPGGNPEAGVNSFSWRLVRGKKGAHGGHKSKAKSAARLYKAGDDSLLVISLFPEKLAAQRTHLEVRLLIVEGWLEKADVASVTADAGGKPLDDAKMLEAEGVGFQEESPGRASLKLAAVDAKPGKRALNVGAVSMAEFAESELNPKTLGLSSFEYSVRGLTDARRR